LDKTFNAFYFKGINQHISIKTVTAWIEIYHQTNQKDMKTEISLCQINQNVMKTEISLCQINQNDMKTKISLPFYLNRTFNTLFYFNRTFNTLFYFNRTFLNAFIFGQNLYYGVVLFVSFKIYVYFYIGAFCRGL
jgi:hypothetical protein